MITREEFEKLFPPDQDENYLKDREELEKAWQWVLGIGNDSVTIY